MQAVSFQSPTPPAGTPVSPQPQAASREDGGFGQVLRALSDQAPRSGPEADMADSGPTEGTHSDDPLAQAEVQADLSAPLAVPDLAMTDTPPTDIPDPADQSEANPAGAADLLALLVSGTTLAAHLPPVAFAITQAAEGATPLLALAFPPAGLAIADADTGAMVIPDPPQPRLDVADIRPAPAQVPVLSMGAGQVPDPESLSLSVPAAPGRRPVAETSMPAHIVTAAPDSGAPFVAPQAGAVPAVFAFRSAGHPAASEQPEPEAEAGPAAPAAAQATPAATLAEPELAAATMPPAGSQETLVPSFPTGDPDIPFGAPSASGQTAQATPLQGTGTPFVPAPLAAALSDLLLRRTDGPVELTLSPEELGRVRLNLSPDGTGLHVTVQVERSDTLDLLRRNSDLLLQEIRAQGFSGATFSFSGWDGNPGDPGGPQAQPSGPDAMPQAQSPGPAVSVPPEFPSPATGLDLRL